MIFKDKRKFKIKKESDCSKCIHNKVCKMDRTLFCKNYIFGTSAKLGCMSCLNNFTRWGNGDGNLLCFICKYFKKKEVKK